jgi:hypothetical protein
VQALKQKIPASLAAVALLFWRIWVVLRTRHPYDWGLLLAALTEEQPQSHRGTEQRGFLVICPGIRSLL